MQETDFPLIVTGAGGRVGRLLRRVMPAATVWVTRRPCIAGDVAWDDFLKGAPDGAVVVHLAGAVRGDLGVNAALAQQVCGLAGVRHVLVASTAAVYAPQAADLDEGVLPDPKSAYGRAKLAMEQAVRGHGVTLLRIGNVAGADALLGGLQAGVRATLDPVAGQAGGPVRSYIGPVTLARVVVALARQAGALPQVLNVAQPGAVAMADLLAAAGADWQFGPPNAAVVPRVVLDVGRLTAIVPLPQVSAKGLVNEWRRVT